jgi:uncharacterized Ntn-hydrolase superfamily protein
MAEVSHGPLGLALLRGGRSARQVLDGLLATDEGKELRQVAIVDSSGNVAVHTGKRCISQAGHVEGEGFSVQANMMLNDTVWQAMADAYREALKDPALDLAERFLLAMEAAETCSGDIRGKQSAAIKIAEASLTSVPWKGLVMDLRIEDHPTPVPELRRLVNIHRAYRFMNQGDEYLGKGEVEKAFEAYHAAESHAPQIIEIPFWNAVTLVEGGRLEEALPIFREVFSKEPVWVELLKRLPRSGLLRDAPELIQRIITEGQSVEK